ncbi:MAG: hypothetical protein M0D55_08800 [Elusimicrobiota bacterium]|nr:MAG: hypothetical protein M0D55_08800 [Elusimicrobiota bacterium]
MVKEIRGQLGTNKWKAQLDLFAMHFVRYYQCRSHADGKPRCGALENFHEPEIGLIGNTAKICSDNLHKDRFFYAAAQKKPKARKLCLQFLKSGNDTFAPESRERACDAWLAHWEDSKAACAALTVPGMAYAEKQEKWVKHCPETLASFYGEDSYCKEFKGFTMNNDPANPEECNDKQECTDYGAFLKASKAGDAELCGESGLCRFFMTNKPESCGVYAKQLEDWYCGRFSWPEFAKASP